MAQKRSRLASTRITTHALVVRVVAYGEADAIVTYFTEELGKVAALGRGARASKRRFPGALEPMHTHRITLDDRPSRELATLVDSEIVRPRLRLAASLEGLEAAGQALRWVRAGSPPRTQEPSIWGELVELLDRLEGEAGPVSTHLAASGLRLLACFGYGLDFDVCVRCGRLRGAGRAGYVGPAFGGVVCRGCGGASRKLSGDVLTRLSEAAVGEGTLLPEDATVALELVEEALLTHLGD